MVNYAVISDQGQVINVIVWDGVSVWQPPEGCTVEPIFEGSSAGIGWSYADGEFTPPIEEIP
jgi:hypothetical protein